MITNKWKWILTVTVAMGGLATLSFNCAPNMFQSAKFLGTNSSAGLNPGAFDKPDSPWVMLTGNQQYQSMLNVTGQAQTPQQKAEFDLRTGAMAGSDNIAGVNGPMMIATTSLAGEVCNGLMIQEKALPANERTFFGSVDFNLTLKGHTEDSYLIVAGIMAGQFYARALTLQEAQSLTGYYDEFLGIAPADNQAQLSNLYLSLCTAMLSSYDSMTY